MKKVTAKSIPPAFTAIKSFLRQNLFPQALKASFSLPTPNLTITDALYSLFIKSGFTLHPFLSASLISHSSITLPTATSFFPRAINLLNDTVFPDVVVYNSILSGLARFSQPDPVFLVFNQLRQQGLKPDAYSLSSLIKACVEINHNGMAHAVSVKLGFAKNAFLISGLIENYSKNGLLTGAEVCFQDNRCLDSVVWTSMINGYVWNNEFDKAKDVFKEMRGLGLETNEFTLTTMLGGVLEVKEGEQIHGFSQKIGFLNGISICLSNAIMSMYGRFGWTVDAIKVFEEIPERDAVSWTQRIRIAYNGLEAFEVFRFCISGNLEVNEYTVVNVLSRIEGLKMQKLGKQVHAFCHKDNYQSVVSVCNALISMYGKVGEVLKAECVFNEMIAKDSVSWNALITAYADNGVTGKVISLFSQMRKLALGPSEYTIASILDVLSGSNSLGLAMQIHSFLIKWGSMSDDSMLSCLLNSYGKCNGIYHSRRVFDDIDVVDVKLLNAMLSALGHAGNYSEILELFQTRWSSSPEVDNVTFSLVLKACGLLTEMEQGRAIHSLALKSGADVDYYVESAIVDVYCKCGSLDDAEHAFRCTSKDNLAAWNAMMMGYAHCGFYDKVLDIFSGMVESGNQPDEISYLAILSSCCHAGLVNEAHYYLNTMFKIDKIIPKLEHYACVVNLLGHVGLLEEALNIIDEMPILPDAHIWQILLSACTINNNIDLGKVAAKKLLELQPENDSAFILLANLYASAEIWNEAVDLRKEMEEKVVTKETGYSWIQVR
ncbi:pentatricopeptide repeat-containing protein At4g13650-like [Coffea eugenioides]|uniref:pentatricopeptide repeat-containing protein At4g13650-like n=1 Tax=Coffea eugenioides TaxID=49369 RepID=UPI000F613C43|nr:pentatricopeptide repeat-containing protein At4g13650-like [Coffea eugenioides]